MSIEKIAAAAVPYSLAIGNAIGGNVSGGILFGNSANNLAQNSTKLFWDQTNERLGLGIAASLLARLHVKGSGATSATSSAFFTNSGGLKIFEVFDDNQVKICHDGSGGGGIIVTDGQIHWNQYGSINGGASGLQINAQNTAKSIQMFRNVFITGNAGYLNTPDPSAALQIGGNNRGFMPPKVTTVQKNAIAVTAASSGCMVYDTTLNKLCVYTGAAWETVTSL